MISLQRAKLKKILVIFLVVKIFVSACYLIAAINIAELFFPDHTAIAQENQEQPEPTGDPTPAVTSVAPDQLEPTYSGELRADLSSLEEKRLQIQKEENDLKSQREQLETLKLEIEEKIDDLTKIQKEIETALAQKEAKETEAERKRREAELEKTRQLVKVYTSMKPKTAAALIDKLDMEVSLKLFELMKGEQIGNILSFVDRDRAAQLSERLAASAVSP